MRNPFRHNCAATLERQGWQIFDPKGWEAHQEALAAVAAETVRAATHGLPSHMLAGGIIGAFWDELGAERAEKLWGQLSPAIRLPHNGKDAARTARQIVIIFCED